jgi:YD repeat-containing protein
MRYLPLSQPLNLACLPLAVAVSIAFSGAAFAGSITETTSFEYDPVTGYRTAVVQEPDNPQLNLRTSFTYDGFGNRRTTSVSSTATGSAAIEARTVETLNYDSAHPVMPTLSTNALGQSVPFGFDVMNMPAYINGLNNIKTSFVFDRFRRKKSETNEVTGITTLWTYYICGTKSFGPASTCPSRARYATTKQIYQLPSGLTPAPTEYTYYDEAGRVVRSQTVGFDGVSLITQDTEYDSLGRVARVSRPYYPNVTIQWTTNTYDALGRLIVSTTPDNRQIKTSYNGLRTTLTNPLNQNRTSVLNAAGQLVQVIDHQNNAINYKYDAQGNLAQTIDPKGNTVSSSYDARGRKTSIADPDQGTVRFEYDALGQLLKQTDAKNNVTTFSYDLLGRLLKRTEADLVSTWAYDKCGAKGKLCTVSADNGFATSYSYDSLMRPYFVSTTVDVAYNTTTTYDILNRVATQSFPTGLVLKYVYTSLGYLSEVRNNANNKLYWRANARDAEGHLTQQTYGMMLAGLGALAFAARRKSSQKLG